MRQANDAVASEHSIFSNKITIIIYKRVFRAAVNTYISLPIFRGLDARGGKNYEQAHTHKNYEQTHTHTQDNRSNNNNIYYKLFEALKLIHIIYTVLMQNRSCFTRKQTCNGEYTKHCTRSRHQLKMAAPAEVHVSEKRSNFRIRQF